MGQDMNRYASNIKDLLDEIESSIQGKDKDLSILAGLDFINISLMIDKEHIPTTEFEFLQEKYQSLLYQAGFSASDIYGMK